MTSEPAKIRLTRLSPARKPRVVGARPVSAAAAIHAELRAQIVSLQRPPGEPLLESRIALSYGVSRTPVREALLRLADEGLVEIFPQSGTFVARIPLAALPEAILVRKALEETTARLAAERATRSQVIAFEAILERQRESSAAGDRDAFHRADEAFHAAIAEAAGHPGIWTLVQQVKVHVDRYRRLTLPQEGRMTRAIGEHAAVAAGIAAHAPLRAVAAMGVHLDGLLADIPDIRDRNPQYFVAEAPTPGVRPAAARPAEGAGG